MRKRLFKIAIVVLLVPLLPVLFLVFERVRGRISLAHYKRELVSKGEQFSPADFRKTLSGEENGAPEITEAIKQLKEGVLLPKNNPPRMQLTPAGRAIVCFREEEWVNDKATNNWDQIASDLQPNEAILQKIRAALEKPVLQNPLDFSQGSKMTIPHLATAKSLAYWFGAASQLSLQDGSTHDALENLIAQVRLPRLLVEDGILISELVRIVIAAMAKTGIWEALQAEKWSDEDLIKLQRACESQTFAVPMAHSFERELVYGDESYKMLRKSNEDVIQMMYGLEAFFPIDNSERPWWERTLGEFSWGQPVSEFLKKQIYCRIWGFAWLDQHERHYLEHTYRLLSAARMAAREKSFVAIQPGIALLESESTNRNFYDSLRYPDPHSPLLESACVRKAMRAETERSLLICAVALKRYSLRNGKNPDSLESLVPDYILAVPIDHMDGKPIRYRPKDDGSFLLYSIGDDGKDDGGDVGLASGKTNVRIHWERKDFVWPSAAFPEEVELFRKGSDRN